jgi:hypothetical protein
MVVAKAGTLPKLRGLKPKGPCDGSAVKPLIIAAPWRSLESPRC